MIVHLCPLHLRHARPLPADLGSDVLVHKDLHALDLGLDLADEHPYQFYRLRLLPGDKADLNPGHLLSAGAARNAAGRLSLSDPSSATYCRPGGEALRWHR